MNVLKYSIFAYWFESRKEYLIKEDLDRDYTSKSKTIF